MKYFKKYNVHEEDILAEKDEMEKLAIQAELEQQEYYNSKFDNLSGMEICTRYNFDPSINAVDHLIYR